MIAKRKRNVSFGTRLAAPASRLGEWFLRPHTANTKPNGHAPWIDASPELGLLVEKREPVSGPRRIQSGSFFCLFDTEYGMHGDGLTRSFSHAPFAFKDSVIK